MKKYIIFANSISGIGGAQLYILRKLRHMLSNGYEVFLIVGNSNSIKHEELKQFKTLELSQLLYSPNLFNEKKRARLNSQIKEFISHSVTDKIYIESHQTAPSLWGELFAKAVNSVNIVYPLAPFEAKRKIYQSFFEEKLDKEELLGCNKTFIKTNFPKSEAKNNYINIPFDKDEIVILDCPKVQDESFNLNILTMSRIDKTYIKSSILEIIEYSSVNKSVKIKYDIYTNTTSGEKHDELKHIVDSNKNKNLKINLLGPVYPLNNCLYESQDLFIGMGTAILNSASMKLPSLVVDYRNNKYYGFFGKDHYEFGSAFHGADNELSVYLDYFMKNKEKNDELSINAYSLFCSDFESQAVNKKFIDFMERKHKNNITYVNIPSGIFDARDLLDFILIRVFGVKKSLSIRQFIIRILNRRENHI